MTICRLKFFLSSFLLFSFCTFSFLFPYEAKSKEVKITLFHINDTYHVGPVPVKERNEINKEALINKGGMSRIRTLISTYQNNNPEISVLVLHAGDILSPSLLSWKEGLRGKQMIDVLNRVPVDIAAFGNHEFDFGCKNLEKRVQESEFIWLTSNIKFPDTSSVFKKVKNIYIFEHQGIKIGFFGLTIAFRELSTILCKFFF